MQMSHPCSFIARIAPSNVLKESQVLDYCQKVMTIKKSQYLTDRRRSSMIGTMTLAAPGFFSAIIVRLVMMGLELKVRVASSFLNNLCTWIGSCSLVS